MPNRHARREDKTESAVVANALLLVAVTAIVGAVLAFTSDHTDNPPLTALFRAFAIAAPVLVALHWRRHRPASRYPSLLFALGACAAVLAAQSAASPVVFTIGVAAVGLTVAVLFLVAMAFPLGLADRASGIPIGAALATIAMTYVPWLISSSALRVDVPLLDCAGACPPNELAIASLPGPATAALPIIGTVVLAVIATVWIARVGAGLRGTPARRRAAISRLIVGVPALLLAVFLFVAGTRVNAMSDDLGRALSAALAVLWVAVPVSIVATLVRDRLTAAAAADALVSMLATRPSPPHWRSVLAQVSGDPSLLLFSGAADPSMVRREVRGAGRRWLPIDVRGRTLGAIDADAVLTSQPELVDVIVATSAAALLDSSTRDTTRLLEARLAGATLDERTRTSRDLQAGVLSRLVAMRTHASAMLKDAGGATGFSLAGIHMEIDGAIAELRETISSAEPTLISSVGVVAALRAVARRAPIRVRVEDRLTRPHPVRVQLAIYYACLEAIQNATKHAGAQADVTVVLSDAGGPTVAFSVSDDGPGFDQAAARGGTGLFNIRERVESAGGSVTISTSSGHGTTIAGVVPDTLVGAPRGASMAAST